MISGIEIFENVLDPTSHIGLWDFLNTPEWRYGATSGCSPDAQCYFYKHFAGYSASGTEHHDAKRIDEELRVACLPLYKMWCALEHAIVPGHRLSRCYANAMPPGTGGDIHRDSLDPAHLTMIYYPNLTRPAEAGGETVFYDESETHIIGMVSSEPNRLVVFPGSIPHKAHSLSPQSRVDRITLMFKTLGTASEHERGAASDALACHDQPPAHP